MEEADFKLLRSQLHAGSVQIKFIMDQCEVTCLHQPQPLYILLSRMSYLPCYMGEIIEHFGDAAAEAKRTLWLEDFATKSPVKWHLPIGVLSDNRSSQPSNLNPWKVTVHFHRFPDKQVILFEDVESVRKHFTNALKQALYLQHGNAKIGMGMAKSFQLDMWEHLKKNNCDNLVNFEGELGPLYESMQRVPMRFIIGQKPPIQVPIPMINKEGNLTTLKESIELSERIILGGNLMEKSVRIQGLSSEEYLDLPVCMLWKFLRHADRFLYVVLI
mmetsp:Transcript_1085/g.1643  ORF Transcript_1085/g.1643 Transcript_1085/m.1643 type:complete len:273 (+) Transcript_1085:63-881(+)